MELLYKSDITRAIMLLGPIKTLVWLSASQGLPIPPKYIIIKYFNMSRKYYVYVYQMYFFVFILKRAFCPLKCLMTLFFKWKVYPKM